MFPKLSNRLRFENRVSYDRLEIHHHLNLLFLRKNFD